MQTFALACIKIILIHYYNYLKVLLIFASAIVKSHDGR